jgi:hypothetical protein
MGEPLTLLVPVRQLKTFFAPQALDPLVIGPPAFDAEEFADLTVPIPPALLGEPDQSETQLIVVLLLCSVALGTPRNAQDLARSPLRRT